MNIYLVSRKEAGRDIGYDEFSSFVCYAECADDARLMKPWPTSEFPDTYGYYERTSKQRWPVNPEDLEVEYLARTTYDPMLKPRTILSSFRAG